MTKNIAENAPGGSRESGHVRENDALAWYFNRTVSEPWDRLLEVQECVDQEFYTNDAYAMQHSDKTMNHNPWVTSLDSLIIIHYYDSLFMTYSYDSLFMTHSLWLIIYDSLFMTHHL